MSKGQIKKPHSSVNYHKKNALTYPNKHHPDQETGYEAGSIFNLRFIEEELEAQRHFIFGPGHPVKTAKPDSMTLKKLKIILPLWMLMGVVERILYCT